MSRRETSAEIDAMAAEWVVRLDHAALTDVEQRALDLWLAGDVRRQGAFARAKAVYLHAQRTRALGSTFDPDFFIARYQEDDAFEHFTRIDVAPSRPTRRRMIALGGAGLVATGVAAGFGIAMQAAAQSFSTTRGEIRMIPLAEGSTLTLNTASAVRVQLGDEERLIELIHGEVLFDITPNISRAVMVTAGHASIRASGTSFNVSRLEFKPIEILVRRGTVELKADKPGDGFRKVSENSRVVIPSSQPMSIIPVPPSEVSRALAWRDGMLAFEDLPLKDAALEFGRYSNTKIVFADAAIGDETVTGLFSANNPIGFAKSVGLSLGLMAEDKGGSVVLSRHS